VPFENDQALADHFQKHGSDLSDVLTVADYLFSAERFLFGAMSATAIECIRPNGGRARYDSATEEYGAVRPDGFIATYFIPDPAVHGLQTNRDYFESRCR
jgi:filamentous hemagglutinin